MFKESYALVMSPNTNPLKGLPKMVRFQLMTSLAFMWSFIFTMWIGSMQFFGPSAVVHTLVLIGVFLQQKFLRKLEIKLYTKQ